MDIEELALGARAYGVLKDAGIETVEDLCLFTGVQLMHLGNFGKKSLDEVRRALEEHSLSLRSGPADPRLLLSSCTAKARFNVALSPARGDRESLARHTVRELSEIAERLAKVRSRLDKRARNELWRAIGQLCILRQVHETVLAGDGSESAEAAEQHRDNAQA